MRSTKDVMELINKETYEVSGYHDVQDGFIGVDDDGHCVYNSLLRGEMDCDGDEVFVDVSIDQSRVIGITEDGDEVVSISKLIEEKFNAAEDKSMDNLREIISQVRQEHMYSCLVWTDSLPETTI